MEAPFDGLLRRANIPSRKKGESQNKVRLSWLTRPLLGTATVLRLKEESSVLCIAWKMRLFSLKKKGQWVAYAYVPHHYIVPVLFYILFV